MILFHNPLIMTKYFCEFCNKTLLNDKLKSRRMHCRGAKHTLMRKAYYMEIFEQRDVAIEVKAILRDMAAHNTLESTSTTKKPGAALSFKLPPIGSSEGFVMPKEPIGFKLPPEFNFYDRNNFPEDIGEAIRKYT